MTAGLRKDRCAPSAGVRSAEISGQIAHRRADAVAGHHQVGRLDPLGVLGPHPHADHAIAAALQADDLLPAAHRHPLAQPGHHPREAHGDADRDPVGAGRDVPPHRPDVGHDAGVVEGVEAVVGEDERPRRGEAGGTALEHDRVEAPAAQAPGQGEAGQPRAHDDHPRHGSGVTTYWRSQRSR